MRLNDQDKALATASTPTLSVLDFISVLRSARPDNAHYYMNGGCWELFRILRGLWPEAQPYHTWIEISGHVATKIGTHLYDIRGRVKRPILYQPMTCESWPSLRRGHRPHRWHKGYKPIAQ
jgi:hypothetical protein